MKKLAIIILALASCAAPVKEECPKPVQCEVCEIPAKFTVTGPDGKVLNLSQDEFMSLYRLANRYFLLRDSIKDKSIQKNIKIEKTGDDKYDVIIKLDDELSVTVTIKVDNTELNALRNEMRRLTTEEPKVTVDRLNDHQFKITMGVDKVAYSTIITVGNAGWWDWRTGLGTFIGALIGAAIKNAAIIKAVAVFFAL